MEVKVVSYTSPVAIWLSWFISTFLFLSANQILRDALKPTQLSTEIKKPLSTEIKEPLSTGWNYNNTWRSIGDASMKHAIYSAYFDKRTETIAHSRRNANLTVLGSIRIFVVLNLGFQDDIICVLRSKDFLLSKVKADLLKLLVEHHGHKFAAFAVVCPLFKEHVANFKVARPHSVALQYEYNGLSHLTPTFIPISYPRDMDQLYAQPKPVLSVCVGPLQQNYSNVLRIVEFVEMYRILGATHFYFYDMESTPDVKRALNFYRDNGLADVMEWNFPYQTNDVHYAGIVAQYNECVYRANVVDNFRYAAVVDFDEILMPLQHNSLMNFLQEHDKGLTSSYIFRNVFFIKKDSFDEFSTPEKSINRKLYTQTKVRRSVNILPSYTRSKCIVNAHTVIEMGNHNVWSDASGYAEEAVDPTVGLVFHYRDECVFCDDILTLDYTARKYGSLIWDRVNDVCLNIFPNYKGACPTVL